MNSATLTPLDWHIADGQLHLQGELDRETLLPLWQQRETLIQQVDTVNVSRLDRVDSAGLALMVHLRQSAQQPGKTLHFTGITEKLYSLIALYNLQDIITDRR